MCGRVYFGPVGFVLLSSGTEFNEQLLSGRNRGGDHAGGNVVWQSRGFYRLSDWQSHADLECVLLYQRVGFKWC